MRGGMRVCSRVGGGPKRGGMWRRRFHQRRWGRVVRDEDKRTSGKGAQTYVFFINS